MLQTKVVCSVVPQSVLVVCHLMCTGFGLLLTLDVTDEIRIGISVVCHLLGVTDEIGNGIGNVNNIDDCIQRFGITLCFRSKR